MPWNVIRVEDHSKFTITEMQRATEPAFKDIVITSPDDAWKSKTRRQCLEANLGFQDRGTLR